ncbi:MAG TPA: molecular chaperone GroEL, partial [Candidatus Marinimicrobia bacterium]|nr:molecular chaperone GroEL [Candidatus Neomarinimicrobiota bacterium]
KMKISDDKMIGVRIVMRSLEEPVRQIAANAGHEPSIVIQKILEGKGDFGFDANKEEYVNMIDAGVIDPTKVTRVAVENASSIAGLMLTTEAIIADIPEKEAMPGMPDPGMGGMGGMM